MGEHDLDRGVVSLCKALNGLDGITTVESCCGHGDEMFSIWFTADDMNDVVPVCYFASTCHSGCPGWRVIVGTDCGMSPVTYLLEGPKGEPGYEAADIMAVLIEEYITKSVTDT